MSPEFPFLFTILINELLLYPLQTIDMIMSLFENNIPMRFGVLLYSTKFIEKVESNGGEFPFASTENDNQIGEDLSGLVLASFSLVLLIFFFSLIIVITSFHLEYCLK